MHWIVNDLTSLYMIQVSVKRNFRIDCILWSQEILSFTYHAYQAGNYMFTFNSKNASIGYGICWKLTRKTPERLADVAQLLLTSNISDSLLYCFCCWLRASKCGLSEQHSSSAEHQLIWLIHQLSMATLLLSNKNYLFKAIIKTLEHDVKYV